MLFQNRIQVFALAILLFSPLTELFSRSQPVEVDIILSLKNKFETRQRVVYYDSILDQCWDEIGICDEIKGLLAYRFKFPGEVLSLNSDDVINDINTKIGRGSLKISSRSLKSKITHIPHEVSKKDIFDKIQPDLSDRDTLLDEGRWKLKFHSVLLPQSILTWSNDDKLVPFIDLNFNEIKSINFRKRTLIKNINISLLSSSGDSSINFVVKTKWEILRKVLRLGRSLRRGEKLQLEDIKVHWSNKSSSISLREDHLSSLKKHHFVARKDLAKDRVLRWNDYRRQVFFKRGDRVTLRAMKGSFQVDLKGSVVRDALDPERVEVSVDLSGKEVLGKRLDHMTVQYQEND